MKAVELEGSFGIDSLRLVDKPDPKPGHGQVLVRMKASSLNYRDLLVVQGLYNPKMKLPMVPLSDGAGEVVAVGDGVDRFQVGDRVMGIFMQKWIGGDPDEAKGRSALGGGGPGVAAELVALEEQGCVRTPEHLSDEEAATLPCAAVTAWHALFPEGRVKPGDTVLVLGTGGVSLFALQFARAAGAKVFATSGSAEKIPRVRELGAAEVVHYKETPDWGDKIRKLTGGVGVDHVVEVGGAGTMAQSLRAVRIGGHISLIGVLAGPSEFNPMPILMKNVRVQGIYVGSRDMFEAMNRAIALHGLSPVIDKVFPMAEIAKALEHMQRAAHFGKIVLRW